MTRMLLLHFQLRPFFFFIPPKAFDNDLQEPTIEEYITRGANKENKMGRNVIYGGLEVESNGVKRSGDGRRGRKKKEGSRR